MKKIFLIASLCAIPLLAQDKQLNCDSDDGNRDRGSFCEIREVTIPATSSLDVDGGANGGVSVKGWDRNEVLVRSQVRTNGEDDSDARQLAPQIRIDASAGRVRAEGPHVSGRHRGWGVSFEVFVPRQSDLSLRANNGGIHVADVRGRIQFNTTNGGVHLSRLAGDVEGHTTNGGVHLDLSGNHWEGSKCEVTTTNGGVDIRVPENYSAHLEASTTNGGIHVDFPVMVHGQLNRGLSVDLGSGGNLVRATTTNGGVRVGRTGA